ncbi:MAG: DinB family protein [Alphaproteobacteria bacterium]|nr:DinB family protein [Alphaproteobacteria bacterium]
MTQPLAAPASITPLHPGTAEAECACALTGGLDRILADLQQVLATLPAAAYCKAVGGESSVGAHMRHLLEFMQVLADNLESGVIDYESRAHNAAYESDPEAVAAILPQLHAKLTQAVLRLSAHHPLLLRETAFVGGRKITLTTSLGREILFMLQHAIHHLAIIKMQAAAMDIALGAQMGVAVATQIYREQLHG